MANTKKNSICCKIVNFYLRIIRRQKESGYTCTPADKNKNTDNPHTITSIRVYSPFLELSSQCSQKID